MFKSSFSYRWGNQLLGVCSEPPRLSRCLRGWPEMLPLQLPHLPGQPPGPQHLPPLQLGGVWRHWPYVWWPWLSLEDRMDGEMSPANLLQKAPVMPYMRTWLGLGEFRLNLLVKCQHNKTKEFPEIRSWADKRASSCLDATEADMMYACHRSRCLHATEDYLSGGSWCRYDELTN